MKIPYVDTLSQFVLKRSEKKQKISFELIKQLLQYGYEDKEKLLESFHTSMQGLTKEKSEELLYEYGKNEITREKRKPLPIRFLLTLGNPLVILLASLAVIAFVTRDYPTAGIILFMVGLSVILRFIQEEQAYNAAEKLRAMVKTTCAVVFNGEVREIDVRYIVPGDIVQLAAGDIVPGDVRLLNSRDLFVNQSALTGEALPVEKYTSIPEEKKRNPLELPNMCFMGTNVESGTAQGLVLTTGSNTYFGNLAKSIAGQKAETSFDKGVDKFTWLMVGFMLVMTPLVFLINGFGKGNWWEAFLFAVSVAVGLTPEMLPAIVAVNLSKGSLAMSKKKVIVKRLSSIQNFGAMSVLCTDKTGTLTQNKIALIENININGKIDPEILQYAFLNSYYQTGFRNLLDDAVLSHIKSLGVSTCEKDLQKIDELPFDFKRKRLSIVVEDAEHKKFLICKGAVEEVSDICTSYELDGKKEKLTEKERKKLQQLNEEKSNEGFRVIAVAYKELKEDKHYYANNDESSLTFLGFMTFFDPPKETAASAIKKLERYGITVKVLTGDNELVTKKVGKDVGLTQTGSEVLLGSQIEDMNDKKLEEKVENITIFAKLSPEHKKRIVEALQKKHVVGFLGDGINDAPALRAADVGISVNEAVDIAKESADIILLELSLLVLADGVIEGRRVFGNIIKYVRMGASSNFGNMFSVLGASIFLPFLPMAPLQLIANNLLYDLSQTAIPTDTVDVSYIEKPRKWDIAGIRRFMFFFGPTSSIFDYITFGVMIFVFHALTNKALFQTGWFVESLLTQTLIVHVIRSRKIPFVQTWPSRALLLTTAIIIAIGIYLPFSPFAPELGFVGLPVLFWPILVAILLSYIGLTQGVKVWYSRKFGYNQ